MGTRIIEISITICLFNIRSGAMANLKLAIEIEKLGIKPKNQVNILHCVYSKGFTLSLH